MKALSERFWTKVEKTETCWLWTGELDRDGYGRFRVDLDGKRTYKRAHRLAWFLVTSEAPPPELDHLCRVRRCVNPDHLEGVTHQVNMQRAFPVCSKGHDEWRVRANGRRTCLPCKREYEREYRAGRGEEYKMKNREYQKVWRAKQRRDAGES